MKAAYFTGVRELEIRDAPRPKLDRTDAVLLRIDRVGVCGSDVHYYLNGRIGDQVVEYPATIGHECAGTVIEVGPAVKRIRPADRVAVDPAVVCGQCDQCTTGRPNTCRKLQFLGCPGEAPGALAEYRVLPAENCFPIPPNMTLEQAVLVEPLSVGLHSVRLAGDCPDFRAGDCPDFRAGDCPDFRAAKMGLSPLANPGTARRLAVFGAGPIGLSVLLCAKAAAPCKVYMTDLLDERLEVARQCGADWTGNARSDDVTAAIAGQEPRGLDLAFECSGDPACIDQAQRLLTPGGTLVIVGIPPTEQVSFDPHLMRRMELTFKNVRRQIGCVAPVIRMIGQGQLETAPLLTHRFPLEQIRDAFELVAGYRDGVIKAVVDLSSAG
jgi:L-iditol 2-dehydrogenase